MSTYVQVAVCTSENLPLDCLWIANENCILFFISGVHTELLGTEMIVPLQYMMTLKMMTNYYNSNSIIIITQIMCW